MKKLLTVLSGVSLLASSLALSMSPAPVSATGNHNNACVDGNNRGNLTAKWNAADSITFSTANGKLLCNDVTVFFSSYTLPDNYNGNGFTNNPTATPQDIFDSASTVMKKGTTGATTLKIDLPEACKHMQVDLYYAPEIKLVTAAGHGNQYITGKIIEKTEDTCTPVTPEEPPVVVPPVVPPVEAQTPPTPAPVVTTPAPVELPHTGISTAAAIVMSAVAGTAAYAVAYATSKRQ
ncbi:MAG TPA: hypothetical protein VD735_05840 [Candidatus Saccharimonadales bacterium]|nr:hypothetical protein [Candidatus Saccharimonadales bacterium]